MSWDVQFKGGSVFLPQLGWWLDAHQPAPRSFVSHAHFDHLAPHAEVLCSAVTARLMRTRMPARRVEHVLAFGQTEQLTPDTTVTLHPAGHIFGSAQCLLAHGDHGRLLYTGDFKLRRGLSAEPCATPRADVLIMETTFGRSHYVLPPTARVLADIVHFCRSTLDDGDTPVLYGYSLGKSQEVLSSLTGAQLPVMLHPQTAKLTRIYEELGLTFPAHREFDATALAGHVVICPPQGPGSTFLRKIPRPRTAVITGWALDPGARFRYQCDAAFPLSDHADFTDLLRFVDLVQPRLVLTLHGFAADFARTLRDRGIEAWALGADNQLDLAISLGPPEPGGADFQPAAGAATPVAGVPSDAGAAAEDGRGNAEGRPEAGATPSRASTELRHSAAAPEAAADAFARFAAVAEGVRATPSKLEKIAALSAYLAALAPDDAAHAAVFLTGRPFPQADARTLQLGWSVIKRALLALTGRTEADYRRSYQRFADAGDVAEALLAAHPPPAVSSTPSAVPAPDPASTTGHWTLGIGHCDVALRDVAAFFAAVAAARGPLAKLELLEQHLRALTPPEAKYLVKIITGDLRIGLKEGLLEEALAAATQQPLELVREAHMLSGDLAATTRAARAGAGALAAIQLRVFQPVQFMLASPEPTAEAILARLAPPVWLEEKYDGIRCQLHKQGDRVELYSRDLHRITEQFPDLASAARAIPHDFVADGELLAWRDDCALPFAELQKRLGRRGGDDFFLGAELPVSITFYDLLWLDGRPLLKSPLRTRRAALDSIFPPENSETTAADPNRKSRIENRKFRPAPLREVTTATGIDAAFLAARARGNEGLMAKDPASPYTPGRRGHAWLKLKKAYATLDVVVVAVEYGHGKRRGVLSDYTFAVRDDATGALLTVGKAYSGLTDAEIAQLTEHFLANTTEVRGRLRHVVPDTVIEVAFDLIQPSPRHQSGYALRFPRIVRLRPDKPVAEIDTLATCRALAEVGAAPA